MAGMTREPASLVAGTGYATMRSDPLSLDNGGVSGTAYSSGPDFQSEDRLSTGSSQAHSTTGTGIGLPPIPDSLGRALGRLLFLFVAFVVLRLRPVYHMSEKLSNRPSTVYDLSARCCAAG